MVKVNPLATWTDDDIAGYLAEHGLPVHPLVSQGYLSIGCAPTTRPVAEGEDPRAGRWAGHRQDRVRAARLMARDPDNPYGIEFRGHDRAMQFVHPYRHIGELNQIEQLKLDRHPLEVADAISTATRRQGPRPSPRSPARWSA